MVSFPFSSFLFIFLLEFRFCCFPTLKSNNLEKVHGLHCWGYGFGRFRGFGILNLG